MATNVVSLKGAKDESLDAVYEQTLRKLEAAEAELALYGQAVSDAQGELQRLENKHAACVEKSARLKALLVALRGVHPALTLKHGTD